MALEQRTEVEKDPHEAKWGAGAVEQGRFRRRIYLRVVGPQLGHNTAGRKKGSEALRSRCSLGENDTAANRDARAAVGLLPRRRRQRERCTYTPASVEVVRSDL